MTVAITIEDGPRHLDEIVPLLATYDVKATFFFNGINFNFGANLPDHVRTAYNAGHQIASHGWVHRDMRGTSLTYTEKIDNILREENFMLNVIGKVPRYFRFPDAAYDDAALQITNSLGKVVVGYNLDTQGSTDGSTKEAMDIVLARYNEEPGGSFIQVTVEWLDNYAEILAQSVEFWLFRGFTFVTMEECTGAGPAYE